MYFFNLHKNSSFIIRSSAVLINDKQLSKTVRNLEFVKVTPLCLVKIQSFKTPLRVCQENLLHIVFPECDQ